MAGLAVVHGAAVAVLLITGTEFTATAAVAYGVIALITAVPQAFTRAHGFEVACGVSAAVVLAGGLLLAFGGGVLFWPAALPLILAATPIATARPPFALLATAAVLAVPWAVIGALTLS